MKYSYREYFASVSGMLKMKYFCEKAGVSPVAFSRFMKGPDFDWCLSVEKLQKLQDTIISELSEKIA